MDNAQANKISLFQHQSYEDSTYSIQILPIVRKIEKLQVSFISNSLNIYIYILRHIYQSDGIYAFGEHVSFRAKCTRVTKFVEKKKKSISDGIEMFFIHYYYYYLKIMIADILRIIERNKWHFHFP